MSARIPDSFRAVVAGRAPDEDGGISGDAWLGRLPRLLDEHLAAWDLAPDGPAWHGECAAVWPVRRHDGERAALKVTWPHAEARTEHLALGRWDGEGAVRLLAADPASFTLLLERLHGDRDLEGVGILEACEAIGDLMRRLDRVAPPQIPVLADQVPRWLDELSRPVPGVPRRLLQQARSHLEDLAPALDGEAGARLVHTDLHFMNALATIDGADPARGPWLAIDPKPLAGEWAFAVAPAVWNRAEETARAHSAGTHVRMRADIIGDVAGLDPERVRMWTYVRLVVNAVDASGVGAAAEPFLTRMIALAKAFMTP